MMTHVHCFEHVGMTSSSPAIALAHCQSPAQSTHFQSPAQSTKFIRGPKRQHAHPDQQAFGGRESLIGGTMPLQDCQQRENFLDRGKWV